MKKKDTILIVDDVEINRAVLAEMLINDYAVLEADGGDEAIEMIDRRKDISAVLLDLYMPGTSGIDVLKQMNKSGKIDKIPVFVITATDEQNMLLESYHLGAVDVIRKPFIPTFLKCRIDSIIELYTYRKKLERDIKKKENRLNEFMANALEVLVTAIEFRDCESGEHVKRICAYTRILLTKVSNMFEEYHLSKDVIETIATSAVLHDIGKIAISDSILNKPGRLTNEEYEIMKQHTVKGCEMLEKFPKVMDEDIFKYGYDICRHHHERWDGKGYPDGLAGDEISIWSQVVSVADVYDALTSPRVYKKAYSHKKAFEMINNGECGVFNPKIMEAFNKLEKEFAAVEQKYRHEEVC